MTTDTPSGCLDHNQLMHENSNKMLKLTCNLLLLIG